ncbi:hypothetical protein FPQ18DRAFT_17289 [Pyronema domesticum]|nr:hypothetical protein FPQ18DRAFT_17289 [Pyronema domesticum]
MVIVLPPDKRQRTSTSDITIAEIPTESTRGKIFDDFISSLDNFHAEVATRSSSNFLAIVWDDDAEADLHQRLVDGLPKDSSWRMNIGWKPREVIVLVTRLSRRDWDPSQVSKTAFTATNFKPTSQQLMSSQSINNLAASSATANSPVASTVASVPSVASAIPPWVASPVSSVPLIAALAVPLAFFSSSSSLAGLMTRLRYPPPLSGVKNPAGTWRVQRGGPGGPYPLSFASHNHPGIHTAGTQHDGQWQDPCDIGELLMAKSPVEASEVVKDLMLAGIDDLDHARDAVAYLWSFTMRNCLYAPNGLMAAYCHTFDPEGLVTTVARSWRSTGEGRPFSCQ